jgi:hypothetical protein
MKARALNFLLLVLCVVWLFKAARRDFASGDEANGILLSALATFSSALSVFYVIQIFRHLPN